MATDLVTHPEAEEEFDQALDYLDNQSLWAGRRLFAEYNDAVARILGAPESFRIIYGQYRRFNLNKFPFYIICRIRSSSV